MTAEHWQSLTPLSVTRTKEAEAGPESLVSSEQSRPRPGHWFIKTSEEPWWCRGPGRDNGDNRSVTAHPGQMSAPAPEKLYV